MTPILQEFSKPSALGCGLFGVAAPRLEHPKDCTRHLRPHCLTDGFTEIPELRF